MNYISSIILSFLIAFTITPVCPSQGSDQLNLPDGAKMRLGKGRSNGIAYSPDSKKLAVATDIGIWIYDAQTGKELDLFTGGTGVFESIAFSPDGNTLVSDSNDGRILLWETFLSQPTAVEPNGKQFTQWGSIKKTQLYQNYPNPFNPETWIPYQLSSPEDVRIAIYTSDGKLVREIDIGHQAAGLYYEPGRAYYWDGKNEIGEQVTSGLYFYILSAGHFNATRKMLILK